ncbi:hypothetical protein [Aegicerativicinus sediminis]|uniref:hypothetical protein n=1 Tax=Aegicerativicinus sediminis TaxID=2893202 RepID=UPI001E4D8E12|nr:hypothetical protein [Aegicerativicinus sediminis]
MNSQNHTIPASIENEAKTALKFYPQLKETRIEFRFKKNIKKSTMLAQPTFGSFFRSRKKRAYIILISEKFKIENQEFLTTQIPSNVLIGWLGHELGHVMDYSDRSNLNLLWFGIKYLLSDRSIIEAERSADTFAVRHGMENYILDTKDFILNHAHISTIYKNRIRKYYLSPEEIMEVINLRDEREALIQ